MQLLTRQWAALAAAVCLLVTARAVAQPVRCNAEVDQALARANGASQKDVAAELDKALALLDKAVGDDASAECHRLMAFSLAWRADVDGVPEAARRGLRRIAIFQLETAVQKNPNDARAWELKAQAEEDLGLYLEGAGTYNALAWVQPKHTFARGARVRLLVKAGKLEEALAAAREWVAAQPEDWEAHLGLGLRLEALGQVEEAIAEFERSTALDEGIDTAPLAHGSLLAKLGRWKEAEAAFARVDAAEYLLGWYSQGVCRVKQGDAKAARAWMNKLEQEEDGGALARRLLTFIKAPGAVPVLGLAAYETR
ncbi:tetratricopeptide repeat protein [Pyxidicoccus parkwayensis]|uniref:Tetratricopeptide repeat protein n=1 Tax=Pyxidicoccus parkwayensis TaxID=2813578 RepID=A0ABX7NKL2_9BACT|nr:tetratricopeptide repeat protein [Pyxidicoccus parkwaysis]QSQ19295.1 tetratricopeptide repeat protein [Pyxidicoccus parkwaysis]